MVFVFVFKKCCVTVRLISITNMVQDGPRLDPGGTPHSGIQLQLSSSFPYCIQPTKCECKINIIVICICCIRQDRAGFGHICAFIYSDILINIR